MTVTIYYHPDDRKMLKQAKKLAKQRGESISQVAIGAIRAYAEKYTEAVVVGNGKAAK